MNKWAALARDHFLQKAQDPTPKTPEIHLMGVLGVGTGHPCKNSNVDLVASNEPDLNALVRNQTRPLQSAQIEDEALPNDDPDRWCWPHSSAMTGKEINAFNGRLNILSRSGFNVQVAEAMAEKLLARDRDRDDRRMCIECLHLTKRRCGNWQVAGVALSARDAILPMDLIGLLQRCDGFAAAELWREFDVLAHGCAT